MTRQLGRIAAASIVFNSVWEFMHAPLYASAYLSNIYAAAAISAIVGDTVIVISLYLVGRALWGNNWTSRLKLVRAITIALVGALASFLFELGYIALGAWSYGPGMPLIFGTAVGASPVVQMAVTPLLSFWVAGADRRSALR